MFDITIRGPDKTKLAEYGQALQAVAEGVRATKSQGISTGVYTEAQAYFGIFGDIPPSDGFPDGNLNTTLDGQVNPAFLTYQNRDAAARVFSALGDITPVISTFSGQAPLSITFSQPDDQDFDLSTFLQTPGEVAFVNLAKPTNRDRYLELREQLFSKLASSPFIKNFYKFNIIREEPRDFAGLIDNTEVELFLYTSSSRGDQAQFVQNLVATEPEFVREWFSTYLCRACMTVDRQFGPELQFALE